MTGLPGSGARVGRAWAWAGTPISVPPLGWSAPSRGKIGAASVPTWLPLVPLVMPVSVPVAVVVSTLPRKSPVPVVIGATWVPPVPIPAASTSGPAPPRKFAGPATFSATMVLLSVNVLGVVLAGAMLVPPKLAGAMKMPPPTARAAFPVMVLSAMTVAGPPS